MSTEDLRFGVVGLGLRSGLAKHAHLPGEGSRIVAVGLAYTNEALVAPDGRSLYVNETFGRRLSRFPLRRDGSLDLRETTDRNTVVRERNLRLLVELIALG